MLPPSALIGMSRACRAGSMLSVEGLRGYIGIMEKKMETTIVSEVIRVYIYIYYHIYVCICRGYIGISGYKCRRYIGKMELSEVLPCVYI